MKHWQETRLVLDRIAELQRAGVRAALATVVRVQGSAYRHEGAKLLIAEDGSTTGNVSGGCLELDVREVARQVIASGEPELRHYCSSLDEIAAWDLGVGCEGRVDVYIDPVLNARAAERRLLDGGRAFAICSVLRRNGRHWIAEATGASRLEEVDGEPVFVDVLTPPPQLVVIGAGDDARPLVRFALDVGFRVVVVDRRPGLLLPQRFPGAQLIESTAPALPAYLPLDANSFAIVMTHHYADDSAYLRTLLATPVSYIGMLGPRQRTERMLDTLHFAGPIDDARVHGPVGLDIGTDGAEQVALSVLAEIMAVRSGREAWSLRERALPIHAAGIAHAGR